MVGRRECRQKGEKRTGDYKIAELGRGSRNLRQIGDLTLE